MKKTLRRTIQLYNKESQSVIEYNAAYEIETYKTVV